MFSVNKLLIVTAVFEGVTGLFLIFAPALFASVIIGASLTDPSAVLVARLAGTALFTLAIICWQYRDSNATGGIMKALLFYNIAAAALLGYAAAVGFSGRGIWPAILTHVVLALWCMYSLRQDQRG